MVYLPHWPIPASFGNAKIDYELVFDRMLPVLKKLGSPHEKISPSIHITGTNGKGSTAAFLSQILRQNNLTVNLYTSPHIHHVNERIKINNVDISDSELFDLIEEVRHANMKKPITFFEAMTITAILAFYKNKSDFNIFEVGMGARIDATNIIENRAASIITPISFDHEEYLGSKIANIAFEKAHILRANTPLIIGPQPAQAKQMIEIIADDQGALSKYYDQDFSIEINEDLSFNYIDSKNKIDNIERPALAGDHQYINASLAISCALSICDDLSHSAIKKAISNTKWQNRLEKISGSVAKNLNSEDEIFIDSAHNSGGAFAIANWINNSEDGYCNIAIIGFSKQKCKTDFLSIVNNSFDKIIAVRVQGEPYPEETSDIFKLGREMGIKIIEQEDLMTALSLCKELSSKKKKIVIFGSIHLARDLKKLQS